MNLISLKKELNELKKKAVRLFSTQYICERTEKGNLKVIFNDGNVLRLPVIKLRPYQLEDQYKLFIKKKDRFFLVMPRRSGKELESWSFLVQAAIETQGAYMMIYPENTSARRILWKGGITLPDGTFYKFLDMVPSCFLVGEPNKTEMSIELINGSIIYVLGSNANPQKLRGNNARGVVISEYAFCNPQILFGTIMPMLRQNKGWLIIQTTFDGMNHAYQYFEEVKNNPEFVCKKESAITLVDENGQRYITDEMIEADRQAGMPEHLIQQEYFSAVEVNSDKFYFSNEIKIIRDTNRIVERLILPRRPVYSFMDIGVRDETVMILVQFDHNRDPVIIYCHSNTNKTFSYYVDNANKFCNQNGLIIRCFYSPHDGENRSFGESKKNHQPKTIVDFGIDIGVHVEVVEKPLRKAFAIEQMRKMLLRCRFNKENTKRLIECLSSYQKIYNEDLNVYMKEPLHNWASHSVDAFQTMTLAIDSQMINENTRDVIYNNLRD